MKTSIGVAALALFAAVPLSVASAQAFGPYDQVMTIGAVEFRPERDDITDLIDGATGYRLDKAFQVSETPTIALFRAPLALPGGAHVKRLCLWAYDSHLDLDVAVVLIATKLTYGGEDPAQAELALLHSSEAPGFRTYCEDLDLTITPTYDVDGDSNPDPVAWSVRGYFQLSNQVLGFGGVQITWTREVSAAPETPTFNDVPATQQFFRFIEALHASGITTGCGTDIFCPDAPLTRGQMAAFLSKALGLYWPN